MIAPEILNDLRELLHDNLLLRPRHGRIRLMGRFVHYPLDPFDLARNLRPGFLFGMARDAVLGRMRASPGEATSYADALMAGLGPTLCHELHYPFARKLWGLDPSEISVVQAQRRVSAGTLAGIGRRLAAAVPGLRGRRSGHAFYYPRGGFGQISRAIAAEVRRLGGEIRLSSRARAIRLDCGRAQAIHLGNHATSGSASAWGSKVPVDWVFSTIPITDLVRALVPSRSDETMRSANGLSYRAIVLCYLILSVDRLTGYDAHYFPEESFPFTRVSEPKNYAGATQPVGRTGLCAEIPCSPDDDVWQAPNEEIADQVLAGLALAGFPRHLPVERITVRRLRYAYPVYDLGFARRLRVLHECIDRIPNLVTLGRQGLFAHDNTHHGLEMAYRASDCLGEGLKWDAERWQRHQAEFARHVVVD